MLYLKILLKKIFPAKFFKNRFLHGLSLFLQRIGSREIKHWGKRLFVSKKLTFSNSRKWTGKNFPLANNFITSICEALGAYSSEII